MKILENFKLLEFKNKVELEVEGYIFVYDKSTKFLYLFEEERFDQWVKVSIHLPYLEEIIEEIKKYEENK